LFGEPGNYFRCFIIAAFDVVADEDELPGKIAA